jgi:hypothetical protein
MSFFILNVPADEPKHLFIVHQCLLSITTRHHQNIKEPWFRNAHIWRKSKPLHVTHRPNFFPDNLDRCIRHA